MAVKGTMTVIVVSYGEGKSLLPCIESLLRQSLLEKLEKILVIYRGAEDKTIRTVKASLAKSDLVQVVAAQENHLVASRAQGVLLANTEFVAFIDAQCVAPVNWLEKLYHQFLQRRRLCPKTAGVGGGSRLPGNNTPQKLINKMLSLPYLHFGSPQAWIPGIPEKVDHLSTTNAFFCRRSLLKVGNFAPELALAGEDVEMGLRLRKCGYLMWLCPQPVVVNDCAADMREWFQRMYCFGRAEVDRDGLNVFRWRLLPKLCLWLLLMTMASLFFGTLLKVFWVGMAVLLVGSIVSGPAFVIWILSSAAYACGVFSGAVKAINLKVQQSYRRLQVRYET